MNLKKKALKTTDDLTAQLDEKLANVTGLDKALKLLEVKEQIKDLKKEPNWFMGVKDIASLHKGYLNISKMVFQMLFQMLIHLVGINF